MREFARLQTAVLLRRLAFQLGHAAQSGDPEAIHDLRVAVRRFNTCLRVFTQFYPAHSAKRIRIELRELMKLAGVVRNLDITLDFLREAGVPQQAALAAALRDRRTKARARLDRELNRWKSRAFSRKWRTRLQL